MPMFKLHCLDLNAVCCDWCTRECHRGTTVSTLTRHMHIYRCSHHSSFKQCDLYVVRYLQIRLFPGLFVSFVEWKCFNAWSLMLNVAFLFQSSKFGMTSQNVNKICNYYTKVINNLSTTKWRAVKVYLFLVVLGVSPVFSGLSLAQCFRYMELQWSHRLLRAGITGWCNPSERVVSYWIYLLFWSADEVSWRKAYRMHAFFKCEFPFGFHGSADWQYTHTPALHNTHTRIYRNTALTCFTPALHEYTLIL